MVGVTKIEWAEKTWNPVVGCRRVSPGCDNCYAIKEAHRKGSLFAHYSGLPINDGEGIDWTGHWNVAPHHIVNGPVRTRKPTLYFVNSMSDLFGEGVDDETIARIFSVMNACPQHRFQVLTKRPNRAVRLASSLIWSDNIWMGVSIEADKFAGRANLLRQAPAAIRFISAEPLLGPLPSLDLDGIDWVIVGGESGRSRDLIRPMYPEWVREILAKARASGTAFFFKQWGNWDASGRWCRSKADAGRQLDGIVYDEMPTGRRLEAAWTASRPANAASKPTSWNSIEAFRIDLTSEHHAEQAPPRHRDASPRISLREPIWRMLRERGAMEARTLRDAVLQAEGLRTDSARIVNYHAWALVDLIESGWVASFEANVPGKRGRTRKAKLYRGIKPRIRVRQEARA